MFLFVIRPSMFANLCPLKLGSYLPQNLGDRGAISFYDYISERVPRTLRESTTLNHLIICKAGKMIIVLTVFVRMKSANEIHLE